MTKPTTSTTDLRAAWEKIMDTVGPVVNPTLEHEIRQDILIYGTAYIKDGKRVDPMTVYKTDPMTKPTTDLEKAAKEFVENHPGIGDYYFSEYDNVVSFKAGAHWMLDYVKSVETTKDKLDLGDVIENKGRAKAIAEILALLRSEEEKDRPDETLSTYTNDGAHDGYISTGRVADWLSKVLNESQ